MGVTGVAKGEYRAGNDVYFENILKCAGKVPPNCLGSDVVNPIVS